MQPEIHTPRGARLHVPPLHAESIRRWVALVWRDRRLGGPTVALVTALVAFALSFAMPRGPVTSAQALTAMAAGLALGFAGGFVLRSRWAMVLAPAAFAAVFELRWLAIDGPTVDGFRFDSDYGILALILGRGFFGLIVFLPLLLAVALGAALARRVRRTEQVRTGFRRRAGLYSRRLFAALTAIAVATLAFFIAKPGTTPAITGPDGHPVPGSIATLEKVQLGGGEQWISIRGHSIDNPVLLYLQGGPGQSGMPFTRFLFADLERDFVVVDWDQRGTGKSLEALEPTSTYTLDRIVEDTADLANSLRARFREEKIYLAGTSWGTTLGVLAVQRHPELFHAFIGGGQMVSQRETDRRIYRDLKAHATRTDDQTVLSTLREIGEPPYSDVFANAYVMQQYEQLEPDYTLLPEVERIGEEHFREIGPWGVFGREYNLVEKVNVMRGLMETFAVVYPQLQDLDFRRDVKRLAVPVYMLRGSSELAARDDLAVEWFSRLQAPRKRMFTLDHAGHAVMTERATALRRILTETVLPETYGRKEW